MSSVITRDGKHIARPLKVLVALIKEDLQKAKTAADRAAEPYKIAAAEKFVEARSQQTFSEYLSWCHRHFDIRKTQAQLYLSIGKYKENKVGDSEPKVKSGYQYERDVLGYNRPTSGKVVREWRADVDDLAEKARAGQERLERQHEDNMNRQQERAAERLLALKLIDIGYKVLAKELHPDKGGSRDTMQRLSRVRDRLKASA